MTSSNGLKSVVSFIGSMPRIEVNIMRNSEVKIGDFTQSKLEGF
jgi:hypothetical protein